MTLRENVALPLAAYHPQLSRAVLGELAALKLALEGLAGSLLRRQGRQRARDPAIL